MRGVLAHPNTSLSQAEPCFWRWVSGVSANVPAQHEGSLGLCLSKQALLNNLPMTTYTRTQLLLKKNQQKNNNNIKIPQLVCCSTSNLYRPAQTVQMNHLHNHTSEWKEMSISVKPPAPTPSLTLQPEEREATTEELSSLTAVIARAPEVSVSYVPERAQHWHRCSHPSVISVHPQSLELYWLSVKKYYLSFAIKAHLQHLSSASFPQHLLVSHSVNSETGT